jgi:hypothetical protein
MKTYFAYFIGFAQFWFAIQLDYSGLSGCDDFSCILNGK